MNSPVDLTNLRSMTDGDAEMEKELFKEFFTSFEAALATLQASMGENAAETWRKEAHALKGIALNLGAEKLGNVCKAAQEGHLSDSQTKEKMLREMQEEYAKVKSFLQGLI